jgi:transcription termination factor Rho
MYDISQLNDMLIPELKDIADQLSIPHAQKTEKSDLIYKILDKQAVAESTEKTAVAERGRRKRITKSSNAPVAVAEVAEAPAEVAVQVEEPPKKETFKNAGPKRGRKPKTQKEGEQLNFDGPNTDD